MSRVLVTDPNVGSGVGGIAITQGTKPAIVVYGQSDDFNEDTLAGTYQAKLDEDGLSTGGGAVKQNADGISIEGAASSSLGKFNKLSFLYNGTTNEAAYIGESKATGLQQLSLFSGYAGINNYLDIKTQSDNAAKVAALTLTAENTGSGAITNLYLTESSISLEGAPVACVDGLTVNALGDAAADSTLGSDTEANMVFVDASADKVYLGGTTNGVEISKGGNLKLIGTATQWDDLRVEPTIKSSGTNDPAFEKWLDDGGSSRGVYLYSFTDASPASAEKEVFFQMQMPHAWAQTAIHLHVHWIGSHDDTTAAPEWGLEYSWVGLGYVYPSSQIVYTDGNNYTLSGTDPNVTKHKHYLSEFAAITPAAASGQDTISSILIGRLFRHSAGAGDTYNVANNKCGLLYIDCHYEINSFGSQDEIVK